MHIVSAEVGFLSWSFCSKSWWLIRGNRLGVSLVFQLRISLQALGRLIACHGH